MRPARGLAFRVGDRPRPLLLDALAIAIPKSAVFLLGDFGMGVRGLNGGPQALRATGDQQGVKTSSRGCLQALLGELGLLRGFLLNRGNMQAGYDHATLVVKPHHDPAALGIDRGMVGTGDTIPTPAARDDDKWLERPRLQKMTNIRDHASQLT